MPFRRVDRIAVSLGLAGVLLGCGSGAARAREAWTVRTDPPGARVETSTGDIREATPCTLRLKHNDDFDVTITKAGYQTARARIGHEVTGGGDPPVGGAIGAGLGALIRSAHTSLKPNPLVVILTPEIAAGRSGTP